MQEFFTSTLFWGLTITFLSYGLGVILKNKLRLPIFNPLLVAIALTICFLLIFKIDYKSYNEGAKYISYLLTPATVSLAVPLYKKLEILKRNKLAIIIGISGGVLSSLVIILLLALGLRLTHQEYVSFLPKSITTAIGMDISRELGGIVPITVIVIVLTGVFGNIVSDLVFKLFRINNPIARGIALGTSAHAIGTAKAFELGELEGAMSSLSIAIAGILTVLLAPLFAGII